MYNIIGGFAIKHPENQNELAGPDWQSSVKPLREKISWETISVICKAWAYLDVNGSSMAFYEAAPGNTWERDETCSYSLRGNKIILEGVELGTYNSSSKTITWTEDGHSTNFVYSATRPTAATVEVK